MAKWFRWPPDVTRRQTRRDLLLLLDGLENGAFDRGGGDE